VAKSTERDVKALAIAMVWVAGKDAGCPPELFSEHGPGKHVWPRGGTKGKKKVRITAQRRIVSIRRTDEEAHFPYAIIAPSPQKCGKGCGCQMFTALIQGHSA
jgi:hypothetical protein